MRMIEVNMEQCRNEGAGETGDLGENPLTNGIDVPNIRFQQDTPPPRPRTEQISLDALQARRRCRGTRQRWASPAKTTRLTPSRRWARGALPGRYVLTVVRRLIHFGAGLGRRRPPLSLVDSRRRRVPLGDRRQSSRHACVRCVTQIGSDSLTCGTARRGGGPSHIGTSGAFPQPNPAIHSHATVPPEFLSIPSPPLSPSCRTRPPSLRAAKPGTEICSFRIPARLYNLDFLSAKIKLGFRTPPPRSMYSLQTSSSEGSENLCQYAPRRRQKAPYQHVSEFERGKTIRLRETDLSFRDISSRTGHVLLRVWNQWIDEGRAQRRAGTGPRNVIAAREDDRHLVRMAVTDRAASSTVLARTLESAATGVEGSTPSAAGCTGGTHAIASACVVQKPQMPQTAMGTLTPSLACRVANCINLLPPPPFRFPAPRNDVNSESTSWYAHDPMLVRLNLTAHSVVALQTQTSGRRHWRVVKESLTRETPYDTKQRYRNKKNARTTTKTSPDTVYTSRWPDMEDRLRMDEVDYQSKGSADHAPGGGGIPR
ncbi:hypothetical protein PR048_026051 [Dryococelus australis]|uniref:Uncharacterized protein n=1 Tax=Dryococelus australis TaxID=614101 RepID=A0ABQ9GKA3_9NEOP|nr:hypothetical protein PR048_026051 [Dryococelus australis]